MTRRVANKGVRALRRSAVLVALLGWGCAGIDGSGFVRDAQRSQQADKPSGGDDAGQGAVAQPSPAAAVAQGPGFVGPLGPTLSLAAVPRVRGAAQADGAGGALERWCRAVSGLLSSVQRRDCSHNGFRTSGVESVRGWPIAVRDAGSAQAPTRGRVLLLGGMHGDELTSVSLAFWWLRYLDAEGSPFAWRVVPVVNPDGLLAQPPTRVNAHGVDLNRNLPTRGWAQASREYWVEVGRSSRRYPGDAAASEPETRWLVDTIRAFQPDIIVSLHAPYGLLDYDGDLVPPARLGHLPLHDLRVYPGSLGNYGARYLDIPVITIELAHATAMPGPAEARLLWADLTAWLRRSLGAPGQKVALGERVQTPEP